MDEIPKFSFLMEKVIHEYIQVEQQKHCYGTDLLLSRTEIHTVVDIGNNPGIGITALAKKRGITKGASSQMIYKLSFKNLVEKRPSENSDAEVCLYLTEKGKTAYNGHAEYLKTKGRAFYDLVYSMPEEFIDTWIKFLEYWDKQLVEEIENYKE